MHIWRKQNPICPACGTLVADHTEPLARECETLIQARLQNAQETVSLLQEARTALSGQIILAHKNGGKKSGRKQRTSS